MLKLVGCPIAENRIGSLIEVQVIIALVNVAFWFNKVYYQTKKKAAFCKPYGRRHIFFSMKFIASTWQV